MSCLPSTVFKSSIPHVQKTADALVLWRSSGRVVWDVGSSTQNALAEMVPESIQFEGLKVPHPCMWVSIHDGLGVLVYTTGEVVWVSTFSRDWNEVLNVPLNAALTEEIKQEHPYLSGVIALVVWVLWALRSGGLQPVRQVESRSQNKRVRRRLRTHRVSQLVLMARPTCGAVAPLVTPLAPVVHARLSFEGTGIRGGWCSLRMARLCWRSGGALGGRCFTGCGGGWSRTFSAQTLASQSRWRATSRCRELEARNARGTQPRAFSPHEEETSMRARCSTGGTDEARRATRADDPPRAREPGRCPARGV